jgi:hypothetical protein
MLLLSLLPMLLLSLLPMLLLSLLPMLLLMLLVCSVSTVRAVIVPHESAAEGRATISILTAEKWVGKSRNESENIKTIYLLFYATLYLSTIH